MNDMAAALRTMRKFGAGIMTITQFTDVNAGEKSDPGCRERGCAATWGSTACAVKR
jgi:hypothetical protein